MHKEPKQKVRSAQSEGQAEDSGGEGGLAEDTGIFVWRRD